MKIEPCYVEFLQAKLLKEKGFNVECKKVYNLQEENKYPTERGWSTICSNSKIDSEIHQQISALEQHQVIEWLRVVHGIWITAPYSYNDGKVFNWVIVDIKQVEDTDKNCYLSGIDTELVGFNTPQEAYSAAIDYVLNNLI